MPRVIRLTAAEGRKLLKDQPRAHKYRAIPTVLDGQRFDSAGEAQRYAALKLQQRANLIRALATQVEFELHACDLATGELAVIGLFVADFNYIEVATGLRVVEDFKGMATLPLARWKMRHMKAEYGITVIEHRAPRRRR